MGCRKKWRKGRLSKSRRLDAGLRINELQLVSASLLEFCAGLGADAEPVDSVRGRDGSVGFDGDLECVRVKGLDQRCVKLQQRLAAGEDDESLAEGGVAGPFLGR